MPARVKTRVRLARQGKSADIPRNRVQRDAGAMQVNLVVRVTQTVRTTQMLRRTQTVRTTQTRTTRIMMTQMTMTQTMIGKVT